MSTEQSAASRTEVGPVQAAAVGPDQTAVPMQASADLRQRFLGASEIELEVLDLSQDPEPRDVYAVLDDRDDGLLKRARDTDLLLHERGVNAVASDQHHNRVTALDRLLNLRRYRSTRPQIVLGQIHIDAERLDLALDERDMLQVGTRMAQEHLDTRRQRTRSRPRETGLRDIWPPGVGEIRHDRMIGTRNDTLVGPPDGSNGR
jgi:hypothetical protein